jgi:hypothetical protein
MDLRRMVIYQYFDQVRLLVDALFSGLSLLNIAVKHVEQTSFANPGLFTPLALWHSAAY